MSEIGRDDFSKKLVRAGLKLGPEKRWPLLGPLVRLFNGSSSPAYQEIQYYEVEDVVGDFGHPEELLAVEGDENAIFLADYAQRLKKRAVVVAAGKTVMERIIKETGGRAAVAATVGDMALAGPLPNGIEDLGILRSKNVYAAGLRVGTKDLKVGLGVHIKEEAKFFMPPGSYVYNSDVHVGIFHKKHPGAPLV
jgi:hypothetical protein